MWKRHKLSHWKKKPNCDKKEFENYRPFQYSKKLEACLGYIGNLDEKEVNAILKACYCNTHNVGSFRCYVRRNVCKTLAHGLTTSRLDYGGALLYDFIATLMTRLQRVQNSAAWLVNLWSSWTPYTGFQSYRPRPPRFWCRLIKPAPKNYEELMVPYQPTRSPSWITDYHTIAARRDIW